MTTPLPEVDHAAAAEFWSRAIAAGAVAEGTVVPESIEPFGDSTELADQLLELILHGPKRATAASLVDYELSGDELPAVDRYSIATDGAGRPRAVLRTTDVRIGPLSSVDDRFAWDEGEGDRTRDDWLRAHHEYFQRLMPTLGLVFDPDQPTVFERFDLVYAE